MKVTRVFFAHLSACSFYPGSVGLLIASMRSRILLSRFSIRSNSAFAALPDKFIELLLTQDVSQTLRR